MAAAVSTITGLEPPPDADHDGDWRAEIARRIATVSGFIKFLTEVIESDATRRHRGPSAMRDLPALLARYRKLTAADMRAGLFAGS